MLISKLLMLGFKPTGHINIDSRSFTLKATEVRVIPKSHNREAFILIGKVIGQSFLDRENITEDTLTNILELSDKYNGTTA